MSLKEKVLKARSSSIAFSSLSAKQRNDFLIDFSGEIDKQRSFLLSSNKKDLVEHSGKIEESLYQRLVLDESKLNSIVKGLKEIAAFEDPLGQIQIHRELDEKLVLKRISVPIGVICVIFESRPDVIPQILGLLIKTGNAALLKGGTEAANSNAAFLKVLNDSISNFSYIPSNWVHYFSTREEVSQLLDHDDCIDLIIPRGSNELVKSIQSRTRIPVMGHADGICHIYMDKTADLEKSLNVIIDSKTQYPSACNALETLLIDSEIVESVMNRLLKERSDITWFADSQVSKLFPNLKKATEVSWSTEYGNLGCNVKSVNSVEDAITHINTFGSSHTDTILSSDEKSIKEFLQKVDSSSVMVNASTRFADGFRYGFGAEVGISTGRLHARGPVGIEGLLTYKYVLEGDYQIVADYSGSNGRIFTHKNL